MKSTVICNQRGEWVAVAGPESGLSLTITAATAGRDAASDQPTLQERLERAATLVVAFFDLFLGAEPPRRDAYSKDSDGSLPQDRPPSPRARQAVCARPALMNGAQPGASSRRLSAAPYNLARAGGAEGSSSAVPVACYLY